MKEPENVNLSSRQLLSGMNLVARIYKIPERTVFDWLSRYRSGGWQALEGFRLAAQDIRR